MKAVSVRTGLSAHVIRVWEKRYGAVAPARTPSARRMYSEEDVLRLSLLARLTQQGFTISQVAKLPEPELQNLLQPGKPSPPRRVKSPEADEETFVQRALQATRDYDAAGLERAMDDAMVAFGISGVLERLLLRLLRRIGELWSAGELTASQEHFTSAALRDYLAQRAQSMELSPSAPKLVVGTPAGQLHELGAVISAALARKAGWDVTYLGPSLPAAELVHACRANQASVLALSIIYPLDDASLAEELQYLAKLTPASLKVVVGGPNLRFYEKSLTDLGAHILTDLAAFTPLLLELRS